MKKYILPLILILGFTSCKKTIENKQNQMVIDAITTGKWKIGAFQKGSTDVTASFDSYDFKFEKNYTVNATKNNVMVESGTWTPDTDAMTITTGFSTAVEPVSLLNGVWKISKTTWTTVDATQVVNGETRQLHLDKLP